MRCRCKNGEVRDTSAIVGLCSFCCKQVEEIASKRRILLRRVVPGQPSEYIFGGVHVWYWRNRWRVDWSRSAALSVVTDPGLMN